MKKSIKNELRKFFENEEAIDNAAQAVYDMLYETPEDKVLYSDENFRKRKVHGGWEYNFWDTTCKNWEVNWNYVPSLTPIYE